jgi:hypothetical protein
MRVHAYSTRLIGRRKEMLGIVIHHDERIQSFHGESTGNEIMHSESVPYKMGRSGFDDGLYGFCGHSSYLRIFNANIGKRF